MPDINWTFEVILLFLIAVVFGVVPWVTGWVFIILIGVGVRKHRKARQDAYADYTRTKRD